jgi:hypothetical protein
LKCVADGKSFGLFKSIASTADGILSTHISLSELRLSRREFYCILSKMEQAELIDRIDGRYKLTSFGRIVYGCHHKIESILIRDYYKLKAIDAFEESDKLGLTQREEIIDNLIDDQRLKAILVK